MAAYRRKDPKKEIKRKTIRNFLETHVKTGCYENCDVHVNINDIPVHIVCVFEEKKRVIQATGYYTLNDTQSEKFVFEFKTEDLYCTIS